MALNLVIFMYIVTEDDRGHQGQARYESSVGKSSECFPASADGGTDATGQTDERDADETPQLIMPPALPPTLLRSAQSSSSHDNIGS